MTTKAKDYLGQEFIITREFAAPRELVFQAWTDPKHVAQWWGPRGFTNPVCQWNAVSGEPIFVVMRGPDGVDYPMGGEFREVAPPERLVMACGALNEKKEMLFEFVHDVTFTDRGDKTLVTVNSRVTKTTADASRYIGGFKTGMTMSLDRLGELLGNVNATADREPLVIERTFDAPVALVWKALTQADEIREWSFEVSGFKPEVGFAFEFTAEKNETKFVHHCEVTEVVPLHRLVYSWKYAGHPGESLVTIELTDQGGKTHLKLTHAGLESFQATANSHFARGNFQEGWTKLIGTFLKEHVEKK